MFDQEKFLVTEIQSAIYCISDKPVPNRMYYPGNLAYYEIAYRLSGENVSVFNGKKLYNFPGVVEFLPKGIKGAKYYVEKITDGETINIFFDTNFHLPNEPLIIDTSSDSKLKSLFQKLYQVWITKNDGYYLKCMSIFYKILYQIEYQIKKNDRVYLPNNLFQKIEKGIDYIHKNCFDEKLSYSYCSEICNISYSYFKRLFLKKFNMTPSEYVTSLRMNYACELLITRRYSVTSISEMIGYKNVYYFSKVFKKTFGITPTEYQNMN